MGMLQRAPPLFRERDCLAERRRRRQQQQAGRLPADGTQPSLPGFHRLLPVPGTLPAQLHTLPAQLHALGALPFSESMC